MVEQAIPNSTNADADSPRLSRQKDAFASNCGRITVTTVGTGPDIIFIPGLASHANVFAEVARRLSDKYRSHLVGVEGFAGTAAGSNTTGPVMGPVAEDIARYVSEAQLERPAVIGHSMGGAIGMMIAARHPKILGRLMIVDMIPFAGHFFASPDATPETALPRADEIAAQVLSVPQGEITPLLRDMFSGMTRTDAARAQILDWLRSSDRQVVAQSFREVITTDLRPELPGITIPVTVLYVPLPGYPEHPLMSRSYANLPQARLVEITDSNHFIMLDQPHRVIEEIGIFMCH